MASLRVLILSNTRPSRAWRFARRVAMDIPGVEICAIVQKAPSELPFVQQMIEAGGVEPLRSIRGVRARVMRCAEAGAEAVVNAILWFVHGCPLPLSRQTKLTAKAFSRLCARAGCAFFHGKNIGDSKTADFIAKKAPDLVVVLGEIACLPSPAANPRLGWLRMRANEVRSNLNGRDNGVHLRTEHILDDLVQTIGTLTLRRQPRDGEMGNALKCDLIADDILQQAVTGMQSGGPAQASKAVTRWIEDILSPYLAQIGPSSACADLQSRRWLRPVWSLFAETVLLFSPFVVGRNWFRRWRSRHAVLILAHHLVSDRYHRMAMSTEEFWRQVRFLRRHYRIVGLPQAAALLHSGKVSEPTVALTFDDGYADNFISLRAVAEEMGIPVSLFITTEPVTRYTEFRHDVIRGDHGAFAMTWDQIRYWKRRGGAEFGAHTRTHVKCGFVDQAVLVQEIVDSTADFKDELGAIPDFFAFPYGNRANMPPHATALAARTYPYYLSCHGGENLPNQPQRSGHLFRKSAYTEPWELELELQSVFDLVRSLKGFFGVSTQPAAPPEITLRPIDEVLLHSTMNFEQTNSPLTADPPLAKPR